MNSREHLADDLDRLVKRSRWVGYFAWAVAVIVMVYGTPIVYTFLTEHAVPGKVAWLLSLAADAALIVGLIATPVLAELDEPAGWVGTLRWVAGFITWGLQTAGSWTAPKGPDVVGVLSHTAGPLLLFFAVEAASSFQRKVSAKLVEKTRQLESAEQRDADERAHRAEVEATLRSTTAELSAARSEIESLTERLSGAAHSDERYEAEIGSLRRALTEQKETLTAEHSDTLRKLKEKHSEALAKMRAEASLPHLDDRRRRDPKTRSGDTPAKTSPRATLTDEEAVQRLLATPGGDTREWSQRAIVDELKVGYGRAPRLLEQVTEAQQRRRSETGSGDGRRDPDDDAKERAS